MNPSESASETAQDPVEEGWIALAPAHLIPGFLLLAGLLWGLGLDVLVRAHQAGLTAAWGFLLLKWALGAWALAAALQAGARRPIGNLRRAALGLASAALGLQVGSALVPRLLHGPGTSSPFLWMGLHELSTLASLGALVLLLVAREKEAGGGFDAAVTGLAFAGGLGWTGLPVLAIAAVLGHPLLAALGQALREPRAALAGGWFDGQDGDLRARNLGACALASALAFPVLVGQFVLWFSPWRGVGAGSALGWADIPAAALASLILAVHVLRASRRTGRRTGRGLAIAALLALGLPLLLLLAGAVFLVLVLTDVIPFHLF